MSHSGGIGGKSAIEMAADEGAWRDAMPISTSCAFCRWTFEGTAAEGRERAAKHRAKKHPQARDRGRRAANYRIRKRG